ncbi:MAG: PEP-CTERM sorting domain-containing protein [Sedimentisphaerales bacterium]|nr:PEP-CTERM sorting domain-containing protein [Sedimentisphaerales bacterium]
MFHKAKLFTIALTGFVVFFANCTKADVLTFDDIGTTPIDAEPIPDGYGGFDWYTILYLDPSIVTVDSGYANGIVSGDYVALVSNYSHEGIGWLTGNPFTFNGAYFTSVWRDDLNIQVDGYLDNSLIYTTTVTIDTIDPVWFQFEYENIDELKFSASGGTVHDGYIWDNTQFVIDNFSYIPEPSTILLFTFGGLLLKRIHKQL